MFKAKDFIVGEILESENLQVLLEELANRWEEYKKIGKHPIYQCIAGIRYIIAK